MLYGEGNRSDCQPSKTIIGHSLGLQTFSSITLNTGPRLITLRVTFCETDTPEIPDPFDLFHFGTSVYHEKKYMSSKFPLPCSFTPQVTTS